MPTYDYKCDNGHEFEAFQSMKEAPLEHCVQCGAKVRRLIGPGAGFIFKGGGFYLTENRSKDYKEKAKAESSANAPPSTETKKSSDAGTTSTPKESTSKDTPKKSEGSSGTGGGSTGGTPSP